MSWEWPTKTWWNEDQRNIKTLKTTALLKSAESLQRVLEIEQSCCDSARVKTNLQELVWKTRIVYNSNNNNYNNTVTKGLLKGLKDLEVVGRVETIQNTTLLRTARILRRVLETWETCCHSDSSKKPSADVKNSNE